MTLQRATLALLLVASAFADYTPVAVAPAAGAPAPAAPAKDDSKFALLNAQKETLTDDDLSTIFQQDLSALGSSSTVIDGACGAKLDLALKGAASDPNALSFIFTQATEGRLCVMLNQNQNDIDAAMKSFKDTEGFTPVSNNNGPKAPAPSAPKAVAPVIPNMSAPATNAPKVPAPAATPASGSAVNTGNNADPAVVAAQKAKQDEQMKAAQAAISNLFSQVNNKIGTSAQMPNINFNAAANGSGNSANADLGAGLARVAATPAASK